VKFHVLLTTYEMVGSEISTLRSLEYETLIVDEGHRCDLFPLWLCFTLQARSSFCCCIADGPSKSSSSSEHHYLLLD